MSNPARENEVSVADGDLTCRLAGPGLERAGSAGP